jgi:hypothetical protein
VVFADTGALAASARSAVVFADTGALAASARCGVREV